MPCKRTQAVIDLSVRGSFVGRGAMERAQRSLQRAVGAWGRRATVGALLWLAAAAAPTCAGVIRIVGPCSAQPGSTVTFEIQALGYDTTVVAVRGFVAFDPAGLLLVDVTSPAGGPFSAGPLESLPAGADRIGFAALDCGESSPGTDIPVVARLRFQVLAAAGAPLTLGLDGVVALDGDGVALETTTSGASLLVVELPDRDCDGVADAHDNCPDLANPDQADSNQNGIGDACEPLVITLVEFRAQRFGLLGVLVVWETASEFSTSGFHLYRGESATGPWTRINAEMIPAAGSELAGARYQFVDRQALRGLVFYRLEEVGSGGTSRSFAPIEIRLRGGRTGERRERPRPANPDDRGGP